MRSNHGDKAAWLKVKKQVELFVLILLLSDDEVLKNLLKCFNQINQPPQPLNTNTLLQFPVYDLTRLSIGRTVFHGHLFVLAMTGDDKFVLFRDGTLKERHRTELADKHI